MNLRFLSYFTVCLSLLSAAVSCNKNDDDNTTTNYSIYSNTTTLVSSFSLTKDDNVLHHLDSVFFTIDQDRGMIYNADSLPKGTNVSKLCVNMTSASTVSKVEFLVTDGKVQGDKTITYTSTTKDTIDFSGSVKMRVTANDGTTTRLYSVKVNVHNVEPDTLRWPLSSRRELPFSGTLSASKTVGWQGAAATMLCDKGAYYFCTAATPDDGSWNKNALTLDFTPDIDSFVAGETQMYVLSTSNELYASPDGLSWTACGVKWRSILGCYGDRALGIIDDAGTNKHDEFPRADGFAPTALEAGFPVANATPMVLAANEWTTHQQAMIAGGRTEDGSLTSDVWGYDGTRWGRVSRDAAANKLPAIEGAVMVPYYTHKLDTVRYTARQQAAWLMLGGKLADGTMNRTVWLSNNQGVVWTKAPSHYQLAAHVPDFWKAQALVMTHTLSGSAAKAPLAAPYKPSVVTDITEWQCPYIYLCGGYSQSNAALPSVWRGVITRLEFKPVR